MKELAELRSIDIYLLDQFFKERVTEQSRILDAGCGNARNIRYLLDRSYDVTAIDISKEAIDFLKEQYPKQAHSFSCSSIEDYRSERKFDFIICNAVLHFASSHTHFDQMIANLSNLLEDWGILFIRMTSNIKVKNPFILLEEGLWKLRDNSVRYLLTEEKLNEFIENHNFQYLEPLKTVSVADLRYMTTLVLTRG